MTRGEGGIPNPWDGCTMTCRPYRLWLSLLLFAATLAQAQVTVSKVEPPNWWAALPENPTLLLYGTGFVGARVTTNYPGVSVAKVEPGNDGYLFVSLKISPTAKVGTAKFTVSNISGNTSFDFPLLKRECTTSKCHVGLRKDDVMYLIMPDRFANGDPSNDDPAEAKGYYDRNAPRAFHGGDLRGVTQHLPYLQDLGVTALWLTPFWKNANDYHGY